MRKQDIRTIETKEAFKKALVDAVYTRQPFSVQSLAVSAGKSRNTFYIHYKSIQDVIRDIEKDLTEQFIKKAQEVPIDELTKNPYQIARIFNTLILKDEKLSYFVLGSEYASMFLPSFTLLISEWALERYETEKGPSSYAAPTIAFFMGGLIFAVYEWYQKGRKVSPDDVLEKLISMMAGFPSQEILPVKEQPKE